MSSKHSFFPYLIAPLYIKSIKYNYSSLIKNGLEKFSLFSGGPSVLWLLCKFRNGNTNVSAKIGFAVKLEHIPCNKVLIVLKFSQFNCHFLNSIVLYRVCRVKVLVLSNQCPSFKKKKGKEQWNSVYIISGI